MITCSPILLIAAAQAMAKDDGTREAMAVRDERAGESSGMAFIHHAGYWSHFDAQVGASSWPLDVRWTVADVVAVARRYDLLQLHGGPGDLLVRYSGDGALVRVGIVVSTGDRVQFPHESPTWECGVLWSSRAPGEMGRSMWFQGERGDRFIPWYWLPNFRSETFRRRAA